MLIVIAIICLGMFNQEPDLLELEAVRVADNSHTLAYFWRAKIKPGQKPSTYGRRTPPCGDETHGNDTILQRLSNPPHRLPRNRMGNDSAESLK